MSWYQSALKEIDGYNDHWRSKQVEAWTEGDVYNWIASSSWLTLVPVEELPFEQFRHVTGKHLVKWKVSHFLHKDAKNGVFLYLYLQDIMAHHKGKACRNDLVPVVVGITSEVDPAVKEELEGDNVRVPDVAVLHTNTWRKKNLSDWTGLDVYHWLLHLCKENSIPLDKFPFSEFEDFNGMRLLLLSGNDYAKKSSEYGIFIYQSVNHLILHYADNTLNTSDHNENEFATIFTSSSNSMTSDLHQEYHSNHHSSNSHGNYYLNEALPNHDFSTAHQTSTSPPLPHSSYTTMHDKTSSAIKAEAAYPTSHQLYSSSPSEYIHLHNQLPSSSVKYETNPDISSHHYGHYPLDGYSNYRHYHERSTTLTNMDNPPHGHPDKTKLMQYSNPLPIKLEHESSSHQYSTVPSQYASAYPPSPSLQRKKSPLPPPLPPPSSHHAPYHSSLSAPYSSFPHSTPSSLHSEDLYFDSSDRTTQQEETDRRYDNPSHTSDRNISLPLPPPSLHKKVSSSLGNDLKPLPCQTRTQAANEDRQPLASSKEKDQACTREKSTPQSSDKKSHAKKKSTPSTPEKKVKQPTEISKPSNIPYSVLTAYKDTAKITIKFANPSSAPSWRGKQVKLWSNEDVKSWCRTIAPNIGLPASKFPHHLFSDDLDGPKLLEMKKSDFLKKYQKLGENLYSKLEELIVGESCYDSGSEGSNAQTSGSSGTSDENPDDRAYPSSNDNSDSEEEEIDPQTDPLSETHPAPEPPVTRRRPGRPKGVTNRNTRKKEKLGKVWQFLITLLHNPQYNPSLICWEKYEEGKFRFVQSDKVAALWGDTKRNETYNYEKFSRAMRYYYKHDILRSVDGRLIYQFGANAVGWQSENPIDPGERVTLSSSLSRASRHLTQEPHSRQMSRQDPVITQVAQNAIPRELTYDLLSRRVTPQDPIPRQLVHESVSRQLAHESVSRQLAHESVSRQLAHESVSRQLAHESVSRQLAHESVSRQQS